MLVGEAEWNGMQALEAFEKSWNIAAKRPTVRHVRLKQELTHQRIYANIWSAEVEGKLPGISVDLAEIERYPFPKILREFNREFHILGK
jgi:hypothetical protein